jgi:hypothetical protein
MPDYRAKIRPKKGEEIKDIKIFAPCYDDAEKELYKLHIRADDLPKK